MTSPLIDSHCHLDDPQFDPDRNDVLNRCNELNIIQIIIPGVVEQQWHRAFSLSEQHDNIQVAAGLHPLFIDNHNHHSSDALNSTLQAHPETVAVGEIGLDFYHKDDTHDAQRTLFTDQLEIAATYRKPLLLHVRKAHQEVIERTRKHNYIQGIVHAFSGSYEQAKLYIDAGFLIGIGGVITRPNALKLKRVVEKIPLTSIALETDAPDLPPIWAQGTRNSPEQLPSIAERIAQIRKIPLELVAFQTTQNVTTLLKLQHYKRQVCTND
ncbi:MAG: TatD family hydrolase [Gammaproteobacteria bacterium]|jgi:TatD DNase family protein|nr:TatD family hydrolase [Gammaproteobacteria bacterium]MBT3489598.1 TatD family hydrolase [Gammaproteobacteria bacterium]MBT3719082.1 TatD family hydrolase [Gammaproteobacteria bacterium]MBT3843965.1 TatD family hydrolase [Gammaproteobacteria bacterium]MBT3892131.1 TatD family hydrolase [Gammaproteobacteria bacterium]